MVCTCLRRNLAAGCLFNTATTVGYGLKGGQNNYVIIHKLSFVSVTNYKHGLIKGALFFFLLMRYNKRIQEGWRRVSRDLIIHRPYARKLKVLVTRAPQAAAVLREGL